MSLYNEIDPFAAQWTRNLIAAGHIAKGVVDERSIEDLTPADVAGPGQRHFFSGIGVWSYALRLAGVADDADVWTGSCPCQPFSAAGKRGGTSDARHLWPAWFRLIRECRPPAIFGEQVAGRAGLEWFDAVLSDLEGCGYAVGASVLSAASVGAPHIRQRIYFVAYSSEGGREIVGSPRVYDYRESGDDTTGRRATSELANHERDGPQGGRATGPEARPVVGSGEAPDRRMGHASVHGAGEHAGKLPGHESQYEVRAEDGDHASVDPGATRGYWHPADWIPCVDGFARPVEPGAFPLAHGSPARVGRLRGYGNAIVAPLAAAFVRASEAARRGS